MTFQGEPGSTSTVGCIENLTPGRESDDGVSFARTIQK